MELKLNNKLSILIISLIGVLNPIYAAKPLASGDILGRDLLIKGLGSIGHVALGTGDDVGLPTQVVVEVLNENPVVQFNFLSNFKSKSKYWGSRSGLGDYSSGTHDALVEAYHQSWSCANYTTSTAYVVGKGDARNRKPTKCGMWRCDTFIAWNFYSAGYSEIMDNHVMLPINVYYTFPYSNDDASFKSKSIKSEKHVFNKIAQDNEEFFNLSVEELNNLPYERFSEIADIPLQRTTPSHIAKEREFAFDEEAGQIK